MQRQSSKDKVKWGAWLAGVAHCGISSGLVTQAGTDLLQITTVVLMPAQPLHRRQKIPNDRTKEIQNEARILKRSYKQRTSSS
jgi:hypothetical protein